ncbi:MULTISPECIES: SDR family oxidoreductase [Rhizobium]|jgi:dihydroflavonol-4-reductase|uniref:Dihydroflavonol-4-reductase n=1 Tax=Rhizobium lusitanum TaxID=293958 RepID=A0A1C3W9N5_9HYPH|nr:aldehyde reductase [Rhizobium lusitanum]NTJ09138.1 aldehyde reductase [Rhizobium lusitanum]SCB36528.1 dihydroflavonol-4-reductase [Rhizobium lusitanum]
MAKVLVTGGTGFLGAHCVIQLLAAGHEVRATVRDLRREDALRAMLRQGGAGNGANNVALFAADLTADAGWKQAVTDCDYVLHVASPFPGRVPKDENELIRPARDGALRVLRAARDANVRRVVLTSSFAAIGYGKARAGTFTETDWTDPHDPTIQPYQKSKTLAERAAWAFMRDEGGSLELAVIDPTGILGPVLGPDLSTSIHLIKRMLEGSTPGCPDLWFGIVDVRDAADLHVRAMTNPSAAGERFLATAGHFMSVAQMAQTLRDHLGHAARAVSTRQLPNWLLRAAALFDPEVRSLLPELGKRKDATAAKAQRLLGWNPRPPEEAIIATATSLAELNLLKFC